jgi:DNA-directed RNA polymerase specialized sigma24 family protein
MSHAPSIPPPDDLPDRLRALTPLIASIVRDEAGPALLRFDAPDDLVQGAIHEALRAADTLRWEGDAPFRSWVCTIARRHLSARRDYWFAMKRGGSGSGHGPNPHPHAAGVLRLTLSGLAASQAGPATFAFRREQILLATKALAALLPRDRDLVTWAAAGLTAPDMAARLGLSEDAADKARERALARLRKAFLLLQNAARGPNCA